MFVLGKYVNVNGLDQTNKYGEIFKVSDDRINDLEVAVSRAGKEPFIALASDRKGHFRVIMVTKVVRDIGDHKPSGIFYTPLMRTNLNVPVTKKMFVKGLPDGVKQQGILNLITKHGLRIRALTSDPINQLRIGQDEKSHSKDAQP